MKPDNLLSVFLAIAPFSLLAIGGGPSIFGPLQHEMVDVRHWMSGRDYVDLFALARAAPGPATMIAALIGWKVSGLAGAFVATVAIFLPSSLLCYGVSKVWNAYRGRPWRAALEEGLAPVAAGLIFAGGVAIFKVANNGLLGGLVAATSLGVLIARPKTHPFVLLAGGSAAFILGVLVLG